MLSILLIPAALCYTFGKMVGDTRQGWALLTAMLILSGGHCLAGVCGRSGAATRSLAALGVDQTASSHPAGRQYGRQRSALWHRSNSALWATATTAASNGSVNSMHDSFTPLGGLVPLVMMQWARCLRRGWFRAYTACWSSSSWRYSWPG